MEKLNKDKRKTQVNMMDDFSGLPGPVALKPHCNEGAIIFLLAGFFLMALAAALFIWQSGGVFGE